MSGRMPIRTGTFSVPLPGTGGHYGLAPWEYTIGELFSDAGYATAYFGKWHLGDVSGRVPTDQGFDQWWGISESSNDAAYTSHPLYPKDLPIPMVKQSVRGGEVEEVKAFDLQIRPFMDEQITDRTLQFIRDSVAEKKPFFAYVSFTNMHPPLLPQFHDLAPYNVILVTLDEDPTIRLVGNLVNEVGDPINAIDPNSIEIGSAVRVVFDAVTDETTMPRWVAAS